MISRSSPLPAKPSPDLVVVGAGVIGCALAFEAARRGLRATLIDRYEPGSGASRVAGGMLSPLAEVPRPGPFQKLAVRSLRDYPGFLGRIRETAGVEVEAPGTGKILVALSEEEGASLRRRFLSGEALPVAVSWLSGEEVDRAEPALGAATVGGVFFPEDRWVNPHELTEGLRTVAEALGVVTRVGKAVNELLLRRGRVEGVLLEDGTRIPCPLVIVAAGIESPEIRGLPRPLPIHPVKGEILTLRAGAVPVGRMIGRGDVYFVPRADGRTRVGATEHAYDRTPEPDPVRVEDLLGSAGRLVPSLERSALLTVEVGFRPCTPDGLPILGPDPEVAGLWYATGHHRNGILLAPATAELIVSAMVDDASPVPAPFRIERFF